MRKKLLKSIQSVSFAALMIGASGLISRLLGVYRDRLLASEFGAGQILDAYYAAFRIPDLLYNLLVLGALSAGFVPLLTEEFRKSKGEAWKLSNATLSSIVLAIGAASLLVLIAAQPIVSLITPGFDIDTYNLTVLFTRIMLLSPILLGISAVFGGILQSTKRFLGYALAPIFYNLGIIIGILFLADIFGVTGLAWGVVLGSLLHLITQYLGSIHEGWSIRYIKAFWKIPSFRELMKLMLPRTITLGLSQLSFIILTIFASFLATGSLAIFTLAKNLAYVPVGLFGISFAIAVFPRLSETALKPTVRSYNHTLRQITSKILFFVLPAIIVTYLLGEEIVNLILGAGKFVQGGAIAITIFTLIAMIPEMFAQTFLPLYVRAFYARKDTTTPLYAAGIAIILTVIFAIFFSRWWGVIGLALSYGVASIIQLLFLIGLLHKQTNFKIDGKTLGLTLVSTILSGGVIYFANSFNIDMQYSFMAQILDFTIPFTLGAITYFAISYVLKIETSQLLIGKLKQTLKI